jgi:hypothetical protein
MNKAQRIIGLKSGDDLELRLDSNGMDIRIYVTRDNATFATKLNSSDVSEFISELEKFKFDIQMYGPKTKGYKAFRALVLASDHAATEKQIFERWTSHGFETKEKYEKQAEILGIEDDK